MTSCCLATTGPRVQAGAGLAVITPTAPAAPPEVRAACTAAMPHARWHGAAGQGPLLCPCRRGQTSRGPHRRPQGGGACSSLAILHPPTHQCRPTSGREGVVSSFQSSFRVRSSPPAARGSTTRAPLTPQRGTHRERGGGRAATFPAAPLCPEIPGWPPRWSGLGRRPSSPRPEGAPRGRQTVGQSWMLTTTKEGFTRADGRRPGPRDDGFNCLSK